MVLRILLLLTFIVSAQAPRLRYLEYTGDGGDFERTVDTEIGQTISMVSVAPLSSVSNLTHPDFWYVWISELDTVTSTHSTGADADSVCFFNCLGGGGAVAGITTKGIKRVSGDSVIVGKHLNRLDTTYAMWVISDPADSFMVTGFYYGNNVDGPNINTGAADTLRALMVMPGTQNASQAHFAFWSKGNANFQYFGERAADVGISLPTTFNPNQNILAKMNTSGEWYGYFAFYKNAKYVENFSYTGNSAANSADTLTFARSGFTPFLIFGTAFVGGSTTVGVTGGAVFDAINNVSYKHSSLGGADYITGPTASFVKVKTDTIIVKSGGALDINGSNIKIVAVGDLTFYTPPSSSTNSIRQPCEGNTTILNKENIQKQDKYK